VKDAALVESLEALGQLAKKEARAAGYGLYRLDGETGSPEQLQGCGARIGDAEVWFPLRVQGAETLLLAFVFRGNVISKDAARILELMVRVAEGVLGRSLLTVRYAELAARVAESEAQLVYAKIRDRARGLITHDAADGSATEAVARFADTLLRRRETEIMLERLAAGRETEVQERNLAAQAKAVLESVHGMSEEQAHQHLRAASRRSRRPLREVALELIGNRSSFA
jgi:hypothetical protein